MLWRWLSIMLRPCFPIIQLNTRIKCWTENYVAREKSKFSRWRLQTTKLDLTVVANGFVGWSLAVSLFLDIWCSFTFHSMIIFILTIASKGAQNHSRNTYLWKKNYWGSIPHTPLDGCTHSAQDIDNLKAPPKLKKLSTAMNLGGQCPNKANMNIVSSLKYYMNICSENSATNKMTLFMFCWNFEWTRDALDHGRYRSDIEKQMCMSSVALRRQGHWQI